MMPPEDPFLEDEAALREWLSAAPDWAPVARPIYHGELSGIFGRPVYIDPSLPEGSAIYGPASYTFSSDEAVRIGGAAIRAEHIRARQERFAQRGVLGTVANWLHDLVRR